MAQPLPSRTAVIKNGLSSASPQPDFPCNLKRPTSLARSGSRLMHPISWLLPPAHGFRPMGHSRIHATGVALKLPVMPCIGLVFECMVAVGSTDADWAAASKESP